MKDLLSLVEAVSSPKGPKAAPSNPEVEVIDPSASPFSHAMFTGYLKDMKFPATGDMVISIVVPYSQADYALPLRKTYGMTLDCQFKRKATLYER
ncbi:MAG: hypothetical protein ACREBW_01495 [Candidatus Micrarchaeaceae archaeon]